MLGVVHAAARRVVFGDRAHAHARGARFLYPATRTLLDVGGQTMKASRLDERGRVVSFRLNDKCAAGTGAFLEKTARYLGYATPEIGALASLVDRSVQLLRRVRIDPECTLVGGILRFDTMAGMVRERVEGPVNVPAGDLAQFTGALGAAVLALQRRARAGKEAA